MYRENVASLRGIFNYAFPPPINLWGRPRSEFSLWGRPWCEIPDHLLQAVSGEAASCLSSQPLNSICLTYICLWMGPQFIQESTPLPFPAGTGEQGLLWWGCCRVRALQRHSLRCADFPQQNEGNGFFFAAVHDYSQALERLYIKSIRKTKLWSVSWVLEITKMVSF